MVCSGGCSGLSLALKTLLNPGDKVLIQDPGWEYLPCLIENCNGQVKKLNYFKAYAFTKQWDRLIKEIFEQINEGIKVLVINSPLNPTGEIIPAELLQQITIMCEKHNVWFISDDVTTDFNYTEAGIHCNCFYNSKNFISVNSFSKNFGISGLRFGFIIGSEQFIKHLIKSQLYTCMYPNSFIQEAVRRYLAMGKNIYLGFLENITALFRQRAKNYFLLFNSISELEVNPVDGGMFLFPKLRDGHTINYDILLNQFGLVVTPCFAFSSACQNHFRIFLGIENETMLEAVQIEAVQIEAVQILKKYLITNVLVAGAASVFLIKHPLWLIAQRWFMGVILIILSLHLALPKL
ncbi:hypothetical protein GAMM_40243 [Gammaproteobacteria bacterium]